MMEYRIGSLRPSSATCATSSSMMTGTTTSTTTAMTTKGTTTAVPIEYIKAKRREVEERLEALLALQTKMEQQQSNNGNSSNDNMNRDSNGGGGGTGFTSGNSLNNINNTNHHRQHSRIDSSDWLSIFGSFVPLKEATTNRTPPAAPSSSSANANFSYTAMQQSHSHNRNRATTRSSHTNSNYSWTAASDFDLPQQQQRNSNCMSNSCHSLLTTVDEEDDMKNMNSAMPSLPAPASLGFIPAQQQQIQHQQPSQAAASTTSRRISPDNSFYQDAFVVSDRLAEILPELDMSNLAGPDDIEDPDNDGLQQFLNDSSQDAWLVKPRNAPSSSNNNNNSYIMNYDNNNSAAATASMVHSVSLNEFQMFRTMTTPTPTLSSSSTSPTTTAALSSDFSSIRQSKSSKSNKRSMPKTAAAAAAHNSTAGGGTGTGGRKLGRPSAFPQKLYKMLMEIYETNSHLGDVVGFVADGSAFEIYQNEAFVDQILPQYFKMTSFSSFQRQLQLYNFKRVTRGGAYRHPLFHRDQPNDLSKMVRKQSKPSTFAVALSGTDTEKQQQKQR